LEETIKEGGVEKGVQGADEHTTLYENLEPPKVQAGDASDVGQLPNIIGSVARPHAQ